MDFAVVANIKRAIEAMREAGIAIFAAEAGGNMPPWNADLAGPVALLLGSEGQGVRPTVRAACDGVISIPRRGHVNSLNVSVSAGMLLYEALRQRLGNR
jgi:23S rRNA (guanosine2251-2'-O)-methyltransferase